MADVRPKVSIVRFYEDELLVLDDSHMVVLRPACEALGLDPDSQRKRLESAPWSTTAVMTAVGADERMREMFCIHVDTVPMWLATIETSRVKPEAREKLERYQREAAKVLADHFYGRQGPAFDSADFIATLATAVATAIRQSQTSDPRAFAEDAGIRPVLAKVVSNTITRKAKTVTRGKPEAYRSERFSIDADLRARVSWIGAGAKWERFPMARWPELRNLLEAMDRESIRLGESTPVQLVIPTPEAPKPQ